jgi:hypothetical protein
MNVPDWFVKAMTPKTIHVTVWGKDKDGKDINENFDFKGFLRGMDINLGFVRGIDKLREKYGDVKLEWSAMKD